MEDLPHYADAFAVQRGRCFRFAAEDPASRGSRRPAEAGRLAGHLPSA